MGSYQRMKGDKNMNWQRIKKGVAGTAIAITLMFGSVMIMETAAQAQDRHRDRDGRSDRDRDGRWDRDRDGRSDRDRDWQRRREIERARELARLRELQRRREWERDRRVFTPAPRVYPYGGYGNYGGYNNGEAQRGYRDGLDRGQEDARDRRSPTKPSR